MKWFDNWILRKAESINMERNGISIDESPPQWKNSSAKHRHLGISQSVGESLDTPAVRFKMFKASGGTIIETNIYDEQRDRTINGLYVITNDKNIGEEIGKILTLESLKV